VIADHHDEESEMRSDPLHRLRTLAVILALLSFLTGGAGLAETQPFGPGDRIDEFELLDQHDEARRVDLSTQIVLFSRDMDGGKLLRESLVETKKGLLDEKAAAYVADISGMPSLVARMFALPSMRKRPYPILLDRTGDVTQRLPDVEGEATLIFLDALRIERVEHVDSAQGVRLLLGLEPRSED
jgi:hypothetical protein